jgi:tRNA (guanine26-N2/guanine27-N2)-dimethyltransferase
LNELPDSITSRLIVTAADMDEAALELVEVLESEFPSKNGELNLLLGDLRSSVLTQGWHWIDIDPFGSPVAFLDTAIQALARHGVLEVSATDTAALSGSSKNPLMRRYGARVRLDKLKHDSGLRVLIANVARAAARHDRSIKPLLSIWDSHHLRVSIQVKKVMSGANNIEESLGWRVYSPTKEEIAFSRKSGLLPLDESESSPIRCMLPLSYPIEREDSRVSGPLWIGAMGDSSAMKSMSAERALDLCGPEYTEEDPAEWVLKDFDAERRKIVRSVRNISQEADAIHGCHLIAVDELSGWLGKGGPPSPSKMVDQIKDLGYSAAVSHYSEPALRTDAPWSVVIAAFERVSTTDV